MNPEMQKAMMPSASIHGTSLTTVVGNAPKSNMFVRWLGFWAVLVQQHDHGAVSACVFWRSAEGEDVGVLYQPIFNVGFECGFVVVRIEALPMNDADHALCLIDRLVEECAGGDAGFFDGFTV